jgi:hypothetical protein
MQFKILPKHVETIIEAMESKVYARGEGYIHAVKPVNYGQLRIRIKQPSSPYSAQLYWLCTIHFEKGLRPNRFFDCTEVNEFAEQYIRPYRYPS